jgi:uncharacterized membrane protein YjgN (DUF898 family)
MSKDFWLTGDRAETQRRVVKQNILIGIFFGALFIISRVEAPGLSIFILLILVILLIFRIARGETFFQLRLKELKSGKSDSEKILNDIGLNKDGNKK